MKKVTIFVAAYNQAPFLEEALDSALEQSFPKDQYEILVINDGSTDHTSEILDSKKYQGKIRAYSQANQGLVKSCNRGIELSEAEYFIRLDSDDFFEKDMLSTLVDEAQKNPSAVAVFSDRFKLVNQDRSIVNLTGRNVYEMVACGVLMKTSDLKRVGGYRATFWEEYDLFLRLKELGEFKHIAKPLYTYRFHQNNMTNNIPNRVQGWKDLIQLHGKEKVLQSEDWTQFEELGKILRDEE